MAWVKIDDGFFRHPKVVTAGRDARDLYLAALCYAGAQLTDGFVPAGALRQIGADADIDTPAVAAARLVATGLWHAVEGGWRVHDYLEYQPSAEQVKAQRAATAERVSRWRASHRPSQDGYEGDGNGSSNAVTNGRVTPAPVPSPVPVPPPTPEPGPAPVGADAHAPASEPPPGKRVKGPAAFEAFMAVYPIGAGRAKALEVWRALRPDGETADAILAGVEAWKATKRWRENYVMEPARWLKERRWEDKVEADTGLARASPNGHVNGKRSKLDIIRAGIGVREAGNDRGGTEGGHGDPVAYLAPPGGGRGDGERDDEPVRRAAGRPG